MKLGEETGCIRPRQHPPGRHPPADAQNSRYPSSPKNSIDNNDVEQGNHTPGNQLVCRNRPKPWLHIDRPVYRDKIVGVSQHGGLVSAEE